MAAAGKPSDSGRSYGGGGAAAPRGWGSGSGAGSGAPPSRSFTARPIPSASAAAPAPSGEGVVPAAIAQVVGPALRSSALDVARRRQLFEHLDVKPASAEALATLGESLGPRAQLSVDEKKEIAHVLLDGCVGDLSFLEGAGRSQAVGWMLDDLRLLREGPVRDSLIRDFTACKARAEEMERRSPISGILGSECDKLGAKYAAQIRDAEVSVPYLLGVGWDGHGVLACFTKKPSGRFRFEVMNTGEGVGTYHERIVGRGKQLVRTHMIFDEVPFADLMLGEAVFVQWLLRLARFRFAKRPENLPTLFYDVLLQHLSPFQVAGSTDFATPQRSGTCAFASLKAYVRLKVGLGEYKKFSLALKIETLKAKYARYRECLQGDDETLLTLLKTAAERVVKAITKRIELHPETTVAWTEDLAICSGIYLKCVEAHSQREEKEGRVSAYPAVREGDIDGLPMDFRFLEIRAAVCLDLPALPSRCTTLSEFLRALGDISAQCSALMREDLNRGWLMAAIRALPSARDVREFPQDLTIGEALFYHLETIVATLYPSRKDRDPGRNPNLVSAELRLALLKMYALTYAIVEQWEKRLPVEKRILGRYAVHPQLELELNNRCCPLLQSLVRERWQEYQDLVQFFTEVNRDKRECCVGARKGHREYPEDFEVVFYKEVLQGLDPSPTDICYLSIARLEGVSMPLQDHMRREAVHVVVMCTIANHVADGCLGISLLEGGGLTTRPLGIVSNQFVGRLTEQLSYPVMRKGREILDLPEEVIQSDVAEAVRVFDTTASLHYLFSDLKTHPEVIEKKHFIPCVESALARLSSEEIAALFRDPAEITLVESALTHALERMALIRKEEPEAFVTLLALAVRMRTLFISCDKEAGALFCPAIEDCIEPAKALGQGRVYALALRLVLETGNAKEIALAWMAWGVAGASCIEADGAREEVIVRAVRDRLFEPLLEVSKEDLLSFAIEVFDHLKLDLVPTHVERMAGAIRCHFSGGGQWTIDLYSGRLIQPSGRRLMTNTPLRGTRFDSDIRAGFWRLEDVRGVEKAGREEEYITLAGLGECTRLYYDLFWQHPTEGPLKYRPVYESEYAEMLVVGYAWWRKRDGLRILTKPPLHEIVIRETTRGKFHFEKRPPDEVLQEVTGGFPLSVEIGTFVLASYRAEKRGREGLQYVSFPRYNLSLEREGDHFVIEGDRDLVLEESPFRPLGEFRQFLLFRNRRDGSYRIFVPQFPFSEMKELTTAPRIDLGCLLYDRQPFKMAKVRQLWFSVGGPGLSVRPESEEAKIFLAHLQVREKKYLDAIATVESLEAAPPSSLTEIVKEIPDHHPSAAAVVLRAVLLGAPSNPDTLFQAFEIYASGLDKVEARLRLSAADTQKILRKLPPGPLQVQWQEYLRSGSWSSRHLMVGPSQLEGESKLSIWAKDMLKEISRGGQFRFGDWLEVGASQFMRNVLNARTDEGLRRALQLQVTLLRNLKDLPFTHGDALELAADILARPGIYQRTTEEYLANPELIERDRAGSEKMLVPSALGPMLRLEEIVLPPRIVRTAPLPSRPIFRVIPELHIPETLLGVCAFAASEFVEPFFVEESVPLRGPTHLTNALLPEAPYHGAMQRALAHYQRSVAAAAESAPRSRFVVQEGQKEALLAKLKEALASAEAAANEHTEMLLSKANRVEALSLVEAADVAAGKEGWVSIEQLFMLLSRRNAEAFPGATPEERRALLQESFDNLLLRVRWQRLMRIHELAAAGHMDEAAGQLSHALHYDPLQHPEWLVFEYFAGITLRKQQAEVLEQIPLEEPEAVARVLQLIMGGGKTKVLSAIILFSLTNRGRLPVLVVPSELYTTVLRDLKESLKTAFATTVVSLDFVRQAFADAAMPERILQTLRDAMEDGQVVMIRPEAYQCLNLEYLSAVERGEIGCFPEILRLLDEHAQFLVDECHRVLDPRLEVNFSTGHAQSVPEEQVAMLEDFFAAIQEIDPELLTTDKHLHEGEEWLADHRAAIIDKLLPSLVDSHWAAADLRAYLLGRLKPALIDQFLDVGMGETACAKARNIGLVRYLLWQLLPFALTRSPNRHFGRLPSVMATSARRALQTVPYVAAGTPGATVFSSPTEEVAFGLILALREKANRELLVSVIELHKARARLEENAEAGDTFFRQLCGRDLMAMETEEAKSGVGARLEADARMRLRLQAEFAKLTVTFFPQRMCRTNQDWPHRMIALSGTPSNRLAYPPALASDEAFIFDTGAEGAVIRALLEKAETGSMVHLQRSEDPQTILLSILREHPLKERFRGVQDPSGLFKDYTPRQIADALSATITELRLPLEGVIYFERDQLCLRLMDGSVKRLSASSRAEIGRFVNPDRVAIFYDEKHTTGTDLPQPPDAFNLVTFGPRLTIVNLLQSLMRQRAFLAGQRAEFIVAAGINPDITVSQIIDEAIRAEAGAQADQVLLAYRHRINAATKSMVLRALQEGVLTSAQWTQMEPLVVEESVKDPIELVHPPEFASGADIIEGLGWMAKRRAIPLAAVPGMMPYIKALEAEIDAVIAEARGNAVLPAPMRSEEMGIEVVVEVEQEAEMELDVETELISEVEAELNRTVASSRQDPAPVDLLSWRQPERARPQELLAQKLRAFNYREIPYHSCFSSNLFVTNQFFDPRAAFYARRQHYGRQILVERRLDGQYWFTLLSLDEAIAARAKLREFYERGSSDLWLMDDAGNFLVLPPERLHLPEEQRDQALLEIAALNGNITYLLRHKEQLKAWLFHPPELTLVKKRMLYLRAWRFTDLRPHLSDPVFKMPPVSFTRAVASTQLERFELTWPGMTPLSASLPVADMGLLAGRVSTRAFEALLRRQREHPDLAALAEGVAAIGVDARAQLLLACQQLHIDRRVQQFINEICDRAEAYDPTRPFTQQKRGALTLSAEPVVLSDRFVVPPAARFDFEDPIYGHTSVELDAAALRSVIASGAGLLFDAILDAQQSGDFASLQPFFARYGATPSAALQRLMHGLAPAAAGLVKVCYAMAYRDPETQLLPEGHLTALPGERRQQMVTFPAMRAAALDLLVEDWAHLPPILDLEQLIAEATAQGGGDIEVGKRRLLQLGDKFHLGPRYRTFLQEMFGRIDQRSFTRPLTQQQANSPYLSRLAPTERGLDPKGPYEVLVNDSVGEVLRATLDAVDCDHIISTGKGAFFDDLIEAAGANDSAGMRTIFERFGPNPKQTLRRLLAGLAGPLARLVKHCYWMGYRSKVSYWFWSFLYGLRNLFYRPR